MLTEQEVEKTTKDISPLERIYTGLSNKNPKIKDKGFDVFKTDMQNDENLQKIFNGLSIKNPRLKDKGFDGFKLDMFPEQPKAKPIDNSMGESIQQLPKDQQKPSDWQEQEEPKKFSFGSDGALPRTEGGREVPEIVQDDNVTTGHVGTFIEDFSRGAEHSAKSSAADIGIAIQDQSLKLNKGIRKVSDWTEGLDVIKNVHESIGWNEWLDKEDARIKESSEDIYAWKKRVLPEMKGTTAESIGGMVPYAALAVAAGLLKNPKLAAAAGAGITTMFGEIGYGEAIQHYDEVKKAKGEPINETERTAAGVAYYLAMAVPMGHWISKAGGKAISNKAVKGVVGKAILETKAGKEIFKAFAKQYPGLAKKILSNVGASIATMEAMGLTKKVADDLIIGEDVTFKDYMATAWESGKSGLMFAAMTAPFSITANSRAVKQRRYAQKEVAITLDAKGNAVELLPVGKDGKQRGIKPDGTEVEVTQKMIDEAFIMPTEQFYQSLDAYGKTGKVSESIDRDAYSGRVMNKLNTLSFSKSVSYGEFEGQTVIVEKAGAAKGTAIIRFKDGTSKTVQEKNITNPEQSKEPAIQVLTTKEGEAVYPIKDNKNGTITVLRQDGTVKEINTNDIQSRKEIFAKDVYDAFMEKYDQIQGVPKESSQLKIEGGEPIQGEQATPPVEPQTPKQQYEVKKQAWIKNSEQVADALIHENGSFVTVKDNQGNNLFVKSGDITDPTGTGIIYVVNEKGGGEKEPIGINDINEQTVQIIPNRDEFMLTRMELFEIEIQEELLPEIGAEVEYDGEPAFIAGEEGDNFLLQVKGEKELIPVPMADLAAPHPMAEEIAAEQPGQPETTPVITEQIGKNSYNFTENEDGSLNLVPEEGQDLSKSLSSLEKEFKENQKWEVVAEKEIVEVPAQSRFDEPTKQTVVKNVQIRQRKEQIATPEASQDSKTSEKEAAPKQIVNNGEPIERQVAQDLIEAAGISKNKNILKGLDVSGDKELSALVEKYFPQPKAAYQINNKKITPGTAKILADNATTSAELDKIKVANDQELAQFIEEKRNTLAEKENIRKGKPELSDAEKQQQAKAPTPEQAKANKKKQAAERKRLAYEETKLRKANKDRALRIEPVNIRQAILQYLAKGGRLNREEIRRELFPRSQSEISSRSWLLTDDAETIDNLRGILNGMPFEAEANELNVFRDELLDIVSTHATRNDMVNSILEIGDQNDVDADMDAYMNDYAEAIIKAEQEEIANEFNLMVEELTSLEEKGLLPSKDDINELFLTKTKTDGEQESDGVGEVVDPDNRKPDGGEGDIVPGSEPGSDVGDTGTGGEKAEIRLTESEIIQEIRDVFASNGKPLRVDRGKQYIINRFSDGNSPIFAEWDYEDIKRVLNLVYHLEQPKLPETVNIPKESEKKLTESESQKAKTEPIKKLEKEKSFHKKKPASKEVAETVPKPTEESKPSQELPVNEISTRIGEPAREDATFSKEDALFNYLATQAGALGNIEGIKRQAKELGIDIKLSQSEYHSLVEKVGEYEAAKTIYDLFEKPSQELPLFSNLEKAEKRVTNKSEIKKAEGEVNQNPTDAQKEAGNYKKGHVTLQGFDISIETVKGTERSGKDDGGKKWSVTMANSYGYFKRTNGTEGNGEEVDVFLGNHPESEKFFVVDQVNKDGSFDEHKVMLGFNSNLTARQGYLANYEKGWTGLGAITELTYDGFTKWLKQNESGTKAKRKPVSEMVSVKKVEEGVENANQEQITAAKKKLKSLNADLKKKVKEIEKRNEVFGDAEQAAGMFGAELFNLANAQEVVNGLKSEISRKEQEINDLTKSGETAAKEAEGQQEIEKPKGNTLIGKNKQGNPVWEDENGNRYVLEGSIKISAPVAIIPGSGFSVDTPESLFTQGRKRFLSTEEVAKFEADKEPVAKKVIPHDGWRDDLIKARDYALKLLGKEKLDKLTNEDSIDWGDRNSIVKAIDEHLAKGKKELKGKSPNEVLDKILDVKGNAKNNEIKWLYENIESLDGLSQTVFNNWIKEHKSVFEDALGIIEKPTIKEIADKSPNIIIAKPGAAAKPKLPPEVQAAIDKMKAELGTGTDIASEPGEEYAGKKPKKELSFQTIMSDGAVVAKFFIEQTPKFADFQKSMQEAIGEGIQPYLKGLYENIRRFPGMEETAGKMDDADFVTSYDFTEKVIIDSKKIDDFWKNVEEEIKVKKWGYDQLNGIEEIFKYSDKQNALIELQDKISGFVDDKSLALTLENNGKVDGTFINSIVNNKENQSKRIAEKLYNEYISEKQKGLTPLEKNLEKAEKRADIKNKPTSLSYTSPVEKIQHTKTGADLYKVKPLERVDRDIFNELKRIAKSFDGYYSSFGKARGFLFKTQENADKFREQLERRFVGEKEIQKPATPKPDLTDRGSIIGKTPQEDLISGIKAFLESGHRITNTPKLTELASAAGMKPGEHYTDIKQLYDIASLALNQYIIEQGDKFSPVKNAYPKDSKEVVSQLNELQNLLPTETQRSAAMVEKQQFSTPLGLAYVANWVARVDKGDAMLEPSAGEGNIATFAKTTGASVYVNEIDKDRTNLLKKLDFDNVSSEDAKYIHAVSALKDKPVTVVVMNPPFSRDIAMGAKLQIHAAEKHIDGALAKLEEGGRLVAIVGKGMSFESPTHSKWWDKIKKTHRVLANVEINGAAYSKKGTTFDNRILVIDKTGETFPSDPIVITRAENYSDLIDILKHIPNRERIIIKDESTTTNNQGEVRPTSDSGTAEVGGTNVSGTGTIADNDARPTEDGGRDSGIPSNGGRGGSGGVGSSGNRPGSQTGTTPIRTGDRRPSSDRPTVRGTEDEPGQLPNKPKNKPGRTVQGTEFSITHTPKLKAQHSENIGYDEYVPEYTIEGGKKHPTKLVESTAMASVSLPKLNYKPHLPKETVESGALSDAQLEDVILAGNSHSQVLPNGETRGFFLGAGTGYGKGRTLAGIILDNWNKGSKKAVWISKNAEAHGDSKEYWEAVGGDSKKIFWHKPAKTAIKQKEGVLLMTFGTLKTGFNPRSESDIARERDELAEMQMNEGIFARPDKPHESRLEQITNWLGEDFDGVIVFDESHKMANSVDTRGARGRKKASQTALAGIELQNRLPNAKIVYSSATGATEVSNLAYAQRLGLWGDGTPFGNVHGFMAAVESSGVAGMEIIARDLKSMGLYTAKTLSFDGVENRTLEHKLLPEQKKLYDQIADAWQLVMTNVNEAIGVTNASSRAKSAAMSRFWGTHQRFFSQIIMTMQMPTVLNDIQKNLADDKAIVLQIVNTNEAGTKRALAEAKAEQGEDIDFETLDLSPKKMLIEYIESGFPTAQFQTTEDHNGNEIQTIVRDSEGEVVQNPEAVAKKEALIAKINKELTLPESPLDVLINTFGADDVAEITGRSVRVVLKPDDNGNLAKVLETRTNSHITKDKQDFMDGKKNILVFSDKGGTGASYHADLSAKNQKQRVHYILQAGWRADSAIQGLGRSHRSNQRIAPIVQLVTTDLKSQRRFLSSIAKRLDQLGALTKGQRQTGGQGALDGSFNLEGTYAKQSLFEFYQAVEAGEVKGVDMSTLEEQMALKIFKEDEDGNRIYNDAVIFNTKTFLNRLMSLRVELMDDVFDGYMNRLENNIQNAKDAGTFDAGIEIVKAISTKVVDEKLIYTDAKTGGETYVTTLELETPNTKITWDMLNADMARFKDKFKGYFKEKTSGRIYGIVEQDVVKSDGSREPKIRRSSISTTSFADRMGFYPKYDKVEDINEAKELWNTELAERPGTSKKIQQIVKGLILPIWNRLPESINVRRYIDDDGNSHLGRYFSRRDIEGILNTFDVANTQSYPTQQIIDVLNDKGVIKLANGFELVKRKYQGLAVIKIGNANSYRDKDRLTRAGAMFNVTSSLSMSGDFMLPMSKAKEGIEKIIELYNSPVTSVENKEGDYVMPDTNNQVNEPTENYRNLQENKSIANENEAIQTQLAWGDTEGLFKAVPFDKPKAIVNVPGKPDLQRKGSYPEPTPDNGITYLERILSDKGQLSFMGDKLTGVAQIRSQADIAFLFKNLESAATENAFAVHMKENGQYKVQYLSTGGSTGTIINVKLIIAAAKEFGTQKVTFVHNHPSGTLEASSNDYMISKQLKAAADIVGLKYESPIIIDLDKGLYSIIDIENTIVDIQPTTTPSIKTYPAKVYQFDRQKLYADSSERTQIKSSVDVAEFLSKQKRGTAGKIHIIIADRSNTVSRYFLEDASMSIKELTKTIIEAIGKHGETVFLSSNGVISAENANKIKRSLEEANTGSLLEVLEIKQEQEIIRNYKSFADEGMLYEPQAPYGKPNKKDYPLLPDYLDAVSKYKAEEAIGEYGAKNLDNAEEATTRLDNLDVARGMEASKKDAKTIKIATGWERGADKKWRYEVPSEEFTKEFVSSLKESGKYYKEPIKMQRFTDLVEVLGEESKIIKAYPELKYIMTSIDVGGIIVSERGSYTKAVSRDEGLTDLEPAINVFAKTINSAQSILHHEIQHAIQGIEGFAQGTNLVEAKMTMTLDEQVEGGMLSLKYDELKKESKSLKPPSDKWRENMMELMEIKKRLRKLSPLNLYKRHAGEVEARNVQSRMYMTDADKRLSLMEETQDVDTKDQIFIYDSLGESQSIANDPGPEYGKSNLFENMENDAMATFRLKKKQNQLYEKIENTPKKLESHYNHTLIKRQIKALQQGHRLGTFDTKALTKAVQGRIVEYANENMPLEGAGRKDLKELLRTVKNTILPEKLQEVFDRIDNMTTGINKKATIKGIDRLLKNNRPKKVGGKPSGKLDPDVYLSLDRIREIRKIVKADDIEKYVDNITEDDVEAVALFATFGNLQEKSMEDVENAFKTLNKIINDGKLWYRDEMMFRKEEMSKLRDRVISKITGGEGTKSSQDYKAEGYKPIYSPVSNFVNRNQSFEWMMDIISLDKTERTGEGWMQTHFGDIINKATNAETKGHRENVELLNEKAGEIFGKTGRKLATALVKNTKQIENSGVTFKYNDGERIEIPMSQNEAYKKWMELQDPTLDKTFERMGWDETTLLQLEAFMTPEIKQWAEWQINEFYPEYYKGVNEVFKKAYFVNLPFNKKYSPLKRDVTKVGDKDDSLLRNKTTMLAGVGSGSLKSRVSNVRHLKLVDGDLVLAQHIAEMEHFKAWVQPVKTLRSVFQSDIIQHTLGHLQGHKVRSIINNQIDDFARGGIDQALVISNLDRVRRNFVTAELGLNYGLFPKQLVSSFTYMMDIPLMDYMSGMLDLVIRPGKVIKELQESELIKNRYKAGWTHEVESALKTTAPNVIAGARSTMNQLRNVLMLPTKLGDRFAIFAGWNVYKYHYKKQIANGASEEVAKEFAMNKFERTVSRSQQSASLKDTSELQKGSVGKLFTMFHNSQQQYFRYENAAIRNLKKGRGSKAHNAKIIFVTHFLLPVLFQMVSNAFTDEDEKTERNRLIRAAILGSWNGLLIAGDMVEYGLEKAFGERWGYSPSPLFGSGEKMGVGLGKSLKGAKDLDIETFVKGIDMMAHATSQLFTGLPYRPGKKIINKVKGWISPDGTDVELENEFKALLRDARKNDEKIDALYDKDKEKYKIKVKSSETINYDYAIGTDKLIKASKRRLKLYKEDGLDDEAMEEQLYINDLMQEAITKNK